MRLSFTKRLTASYLFVVVITLAFSAIFLTHRLSKSFLKQLEESLHSQAVLAAESFGPAIIAGVPSEKLQTQVRDLGARAGLRITAIRRDGLVLADSERTD